MKNNSNLFCLFEEELNKIINNTISSRLFFNLPIFNLALSLASTLNLYVPVDGGNM